MNKIVLFILYLRIIFKKTDFIMIHLIYIDDIDMGHTDKYIFTLAAVSESLCNPNKLSQVMDRVDIV